MRLALFNSNFTFEVDNDDVIQVFDGPGSESKGTIFVDTFGVNAHILVVYANNLPYYFNTINEAVRFVEDAVNVYKDVYVHRGEK